MINCTKDVELENTEKIVLNSLAKVPIIAIYKQPKDYPDLFIGRLWDSNKPTNYIFKGGSLQEIRSKIPGYMIKVDKNKEDDQVIIECWV